MSGKTGGLSAACGVGFGVGVTAGGSTLQDSIDQAYRAVAKIRFPGAHYRRDIGHKGLARIAQ